MAWPLVVSGRCQAGGVSSRIRSEWGSLGERGVAEVGRDGGRVGLPCHVWAWVDTLAGEWRWVPGLLVRWEADGTGSWWGEVALVGESGAAGLLMVGADRLRPVQAAPPLPWA